MLDQFTVFGCIGLINFAACLLIGIFLLAKNFKNPDNLFCAIFDFFIAFYSFFYFLWQSSSDPAYGVLFFKWCIVGVVLINSAFVHFVYVWLKLSQKFKKFVIAAHFLNLIFCLGALSIFYDDWQIKYTYGLWPVPSVYFDVYLIWWLLQVIVCHVLLYRYGIQGTSGTRHQQNLWVFWPTLIAFTGGATNWFVWYGINFPPYFNAAIAVYAAVLAFAVIRYRVFDLEALTAAFHRERLTTLGLLAASINHEVKNPLFVVRGYLDRIIESPHVEESRLAKQAVQQIDRIFDVIKSITYFARSTKAASDARPTAEIKKALKSVLDFVAFEFKTNRIEVAQKISPQIGNVYCDQQQLEGIFFNLIVNACHAMPEGGTITIEAIENDKSVCIRISDTGCGIEDKSKKEVFMPFYSTKGEKGLGLGLSITKQLVECNEGQISFESYPGQGTTFEIRFKKCPKQGTQA